MRSQRLYTLPTWNVLQPLYDKIVIEIYDEYFYMKTMIPYEHDHGVVSQSSLLNSTDHSAHLVIHEADGGIVSSPQLSLLTQ